MSEAELHLLKQRMYQGTLQKARRGALSFALPIGYVHNASGEVVYDTDAQVQHVVRLIFRTFEELGTLHALVRYLVQHDIQLGVRLREGPVKGPLEWRRPNGFDHGVGHSLLVLCDAKVPHGKKWNDFKALENYLFIVSISLS